MALARARGPKVTYSPTSRIQRFTPSPIPAAQAVAYAASRGAEGTYRQYIPAMFQFATELNLDPLVGFGQWLDETDEGQSSRWLAGDPAGIGIFSNTTPSTLPRGLTGRQSAAIHMVELACKVTKWRLTEVGGVNVQAIDPHLSRVHDFIARPNWPRVETIDDLRLPIGSSDFTWAANQNYAVQIAGHINRFLAWCEAHPLEDIGEPAMTVYATTLPGVPGGPLVTTYPINVRILPAWQTINRPGIKARSPRESVQHGNGNDRAYAASDSLWLYNGAKDDQGRPTQTSFHADADHNGVWFNIPADEVTWQSADGAGKGNMNGFSCEMSEHAIYRSNPALLLKNIEVNADFMGRVAGARLGAAAPKRHWDFNYVVAGCSTMCETTHPARHTCPNMLMTMRVAGRLAWDVYAELWEAAKADELKRMNGEVKPTKPKPKARRSAGPINWTPGKDWGVGELNGTPVLRMMIEVEVLKDTQPRQGASSKALSVDAKLTKGKTVMVVGTFNSGWGCIAGAHGDYPRIWLGAVQGPLPKPADFGEV